MCKSGNLLDAIIPKWPIARLLLVYTCKLNWLCVHLYGKLILWTLTGNWLSLVGCSSYDGNSRLELKVWTHWFYKVCTQCAIYQQLVSIKSKFNLSSSQEPSKCLLKKRSWRFTIARYTHLIRRGSLTITNGLLQLDTHQDTSSKVMDPFDAPHIWNTLRCTQASGHVMLELNTKDNVVSRKSYHILFSSYPLLSGHQPARRRYTILRQKGTKPENIWWKWLR